jgi:non-ribosomal peptide synthetase component F
VICDAWSMALMVAEVGELYGTASVGRPFPGSQPELQLADVAAWHRGWLAESGELDRQLAYWRERLAGCPPALALPLDRPRSATRKARGAKVSVRLDRESTGRLTRLGREAGATLFMTLLALYQVLLSRLSGQTDIAIGVPVAGRSRPELEEVVGFFVNTLVLRTDLGDDPPLNRLIPRVRHAALEAFANQDVPFDLLVERLDPERRPGCGPFFQASFMLLAARERGLRLPGLEVSDLEIDEGRRRSDLQLQLLEVPDGLVGAFHYDASLFDAETVEDLARRFAALVAAAAADPEAPVSTLPLLEAGERAALYAGFAGSLEGA